jgi:menaquinone-specific isochorismate synthase
MSKAELRSQLSGPNDQRSTVEQFYVLSKSIKDIPNILNLVPNDGLAWVTGPAMDQSGIVALGEIDRFEVSGPERFSRAQSWWRNWSAKTAGDEPIAFSSFTFANDAGLSVVVVPEIVLCREQGKTTLTLVSKDPISEDYFQETTERFLKPRGVKTQNLNPKFSDGTRSLLDWQKTVDEAVRRIANGELDKVVLARDLVATLSESLDVGALLRELNRTFPECWTFAVDGLVGATPELLVKRQGDQVTSRVLAGTIRRSSDEVRNDQLAAALLASDKDLEEHEYAVASVAAALASHCIDLDVPDKPFILQLANVQHLGTDVTGQLVDAAPVLALAASLHPTAAVCGTPTERAANLIKAIEGMDRGRYSAPVGWMNKSGDGEMVIALRCAVIENPERTRLRLFAGCGIVSGSTGEAEVAESQAKFQAMINALS